ncbi:MAG: hypothetical protein KDK91_01000 [Gammaproteobacteria bacterium]|nr:hypothetical protein [Gammaproteobacteria bacterium]
MATIDVLLNNLASTCMAGKGFELPRRRMPPPTHYLPYGLPEDADPDLGFHAPAQVGTDSNQADPSTEEGDPFFQTAMMGGVQTPVPVPLPSGGVVDLYRVGGCLGDARSAAFGQQDVYLNGIATFLQLQDLSSVAESRADASPEFASLNREWADCMAMGGYSFTSPLEAWGADWSIPVGEDERLAAAADIHCKNDLHYTSRAEALRSGYDDEVIASNLGLLDNWSQFEQLVANSVRDQVE